MCYSSYKRPEQASLFPQKSIFSVNMKLSKSLLSAIILIVIFAAGRALAKLKLDIHIESLCRFSSKFILTQFAPAYEKIKHSADIDFHIYGKSTTTVLNNGTANFKCQHGDWECEKNINMTCVLNFLGDNTDLQAEFVVCAMNFNRSFPALDRECTKSVHVDQSFVDLCVVSSMGRSLQRDVGLLSAPYIGISGRVPTIVYNGIYSQLISGLSQVDFLNTFRGVENGTFKLTG